MSIFNTHRNALDLFFGGNCAFYLLFLHRHSSYDTDTFCFIRHMSLHKASIKRALNTQQFLFVILGQFDMARECVGVFDGDSRTVSHSFFVINFLLLYQILYFNGVFAKSFNFYSCQ